jgi:RNA recognition motif-containing protein
LFVANLPYALSDDELLTLLPKASKAYVAKNYNGRSKGFGFIEFANEDDQKAALASSEKLLAQGRELIVKIALTESKKPENISAPSDAQPAQ